MSIDWEPGHGPEDLKRKLAAARLVGKPAFNFLRRAALLIQGLARENAPKNVGRLRDSIAFNVDQSPMPLFAEIGSAVEYAPHMEYGTGALSDSPSMVSDWQFPTGGELETWAKRHDFTSGEQVAGIIRARGGLAPRRYLRAAFDAARQKIQNFLTQMGREIEEQWRNGM